MGRRARCTSAGFARRAAIPTSTLSRPPPSFARFPRREQAASTRLAALRSGRSLELGGGRRTKEDTIDHAVGIVCQREARPDRRSRRDSRGRACARRGLGFHRDRREFSARTRSETSRRTRTASCSTSSSSSDARASRGRDDSSAARSAPRGPDIRASRDPRPAADTPARPVRGRRRARGRSRRRRRAAWEVPPRAARERARAARPPADDGELRLRAGLARARGHRARRRRTARVPRRAPVRNVARARRCRARAVPRSQERSGTARPALHGRLAGRATRAPEGATQGGRSSTSGSSRGSGTSTRTRRSGARGSTRCGPRTGCLPRRSPGSRARSAQLSAPGSSARDRRCATTPRQTALPARCRTSSACTAATGSRVGDVAQRSRRRASAVAEPGSARAASPSR